MPSTVVERYIPALLAAWEKYEQLASVAPNGTDLSARGELEIGIHVSRWPGNGITLHGHHSLISTRGRIEAIATELQSLPDVAERVRAALAGLDI